MRKILIGAFTAVASLAMAMDNMTESTSMSSSPINMYGHIDLNMAKLTSPGASTDLTASLAVGVTGAYMMTEEMGASMGLDFNMLQGKKSGTTVKNNYLDIPVNFVYNWVPSSGVASLFGIGPFFGLALGKWKTTGAADTKANMAIGMNIENHTTWEISSDFSIGGHVFFKYAFNDLNKDAPESQKYWATGLGVSAKFL